MSGLPPVPEGTPPLDDERAHERIDAALRRLFVVPEDPARAILPLLEPAPAGRGPLGAVRPFLWLVGVAALAAAAWLLFLRPTAPRPDRSPAPGASPRLAQVPLGATTLVPCPPAVGPMTSGDTAPLELAMPDLEVLYDEFVLCDAASAQAMPCALPTDDLAARLSDTYDCCTALRVRPDSPIQLHGPYSSPEWPTATILTGSAQDHPALLVADSDSTHSCCVRPTDPPLGSGLHVFRWRMGEIVFTEITPLPEPYLIGYFEEVRVR